jgi:bla regulator protein blaR1
LYDIRRSEGASPNSHTDTYLRNEVLMIKRLAPHSVWKTLVYFALLPLAAPTALAQATPSMAASLDGPAFAVSVVRASGPTTNRSIKFEPGGRFVARGASVRLLIKIAYNLNDDELTGGPGWIGLDRFDIDAAPDTPDGSAVNMDRVRTRLQGLLADRFQLKMRDEMKMMSTYALMIAKGGPRLKKSATQDAPMQSHLNGGELLFKNATMDQFANAVSDWVRQPVLNQTGLDGEYDLRLEWTPDPAVPGSPTDASASQSISSGPTIFTALQQQMGLSLQARKNQALCKVVEQVVRPAAN